MKAAARFKSKYKSRRRGVRIIHQELPQPSNDQPDNTNLTAQYGYVNGDVIPGSGHLRVKVAPEQVTVDYS